MKAFLISFVVVLVAMILAMAYAPAHGQVDQSNCSDRADALSHLREAYKEQPVAIGLARSGGVVEVLVSEDGSSWSIIITLPTGTACMVVFGEDWETKNVEPGQGL